jgi:hypothetical protein
MNGQIPLSGTKINKRYEYSSAKGDIEETQSPRTKSTIVPSSTRDSELRFSKQKHKFKKKFIKAPNATMTIRGDVDEEDEDL